MPLAIKVLEMRLGLGATASLFAGMWKDVLLVILLAVVALAGSRCRRRRRRYLFEFLIYSYAIYCIVYTAVSPSLLHASYGLRGNVEPFLFYFLFRNIALRPRQFRLLTYWILALSAALAMFAVLQARLWSFSSYQALGYGLVTGNLSSSFTVVGSRWARPTSTFSSPNTAGLFFALSVILAAGYWQRQKELKTRRLLVVVAVLVSVGLLITLSRSGILAVAMGLLVLALLSPRPWQRHRLVVAGVCLVVLVAFVLTAASSNQYVAAIITRAVRTATGTDPSASGRLPDLLNALSTIREHPLGVGLGLVGARTGKFNDVYWMQYHTENYFLQIAMEVGVLGGVILLGAVPECRTCAMAQPRSEGQA